MVILEPKPWKSIGKDEYREKSRHTFTTPQRARSDLSALFPLRRDSSTSPPSSSDGSSSSFWASPEHSICWSPRGYISRRLRNSINNRKFIIIVCLILAFLIWMLPPPTQWRKNEIHVTIPNSPVQSYELLDPQASSTITKRGQDPEQWLERNGNNRYSVNTESRFFGSIGSSARPRAALISLVRNSELEGIMQSMRQLEYRWNHKYQYPWVFFSEEPFTDEFKAATSNLTSARCYYEMIPEEHWSLPDWIDEGRFMNSLEYLGTIGVGKGWMVSYRHMCRWNSGFFYRSKRLQDFDWYWRVEPDVHFYCDIDYDVFRFMRDNNLKYGFNMNILDDARSFPSLWSRTRAFINTHLDLIHPEADLDWLLDSHNGGDYNNCQFFSNFEIGSLDFFRSGANEKYFEWLDRGGGFYYERFGDAPIHTLSLSMFAPKRSIWYFRDIGYQHDINRHCPPNSHHRCSCEPTPLDENFYKLVPLVSPQKKPEHSCIRHFLGGRWLEKVDGWRGEEGTGVGADGDKYGGYRFGGLEDEVGDASGNDQEL